MPSQISKPQWITQWIRSHSHVSTHHMTMEGNAFSGVYSQHHKSLSCDMCNCRMRSKGERSWVMSHTCMSHVTYMYEACHIYVWVMSYICMSHVTYMWHDSVIYVTGLEEASQRREVFEKLSCAKHTCIYIYIYYTYRCRNFERGLHISGQSWESIYLIDTYM